VKRISCGIEEEELEGDNGRMILGVRATCNRCGHSTESFGTEEASITRCLALLREECPMDEHNFYVNEEED
jgi:hypothetical protein